MDKPIIVMIFLQFIYATVTISSRNAFLQGVSPRVFVVYRQAMATLIISPVAFISRKRTGNSCQLGWRAFWLIFSASLIGVTLYQNVYFEGLFLASSSIASAMANVVPAVTFVIAYIVGFEKVNRSLRSMAKILGTVICVSGAIGMSLYKGPKLLNMDLIPKNSLLLNTGNYNDIWLLGCLLLFGSSCAWSLWLILQVPISASYPDNLSSTAWICFLATLQSAALTLFLEPDLNAWKLDSGVEFFSCLYAALGSAISFFGQAWCISRRGPLFSATFSPLNTVIATILAPLIYNEKVYLGGLIGAVAVIFGLYIVLWGKAKDIYVSKEDNLHNNPTETVLIKDGLLDVTSLKVDLEQPLLLDTKESSDIMSCRVDLEQQLFSEDSNK
ncbi:hypothetical protein Leryth_022707 [Lithospermum erythrorhizon]|nr:hypothetical protein Leryth_022707 [Lithospermum erythrorhizon]